MDYNALFEYLSGRLIDLIDYLIKHSEPTPIGYAMWLKTINQSGLFEA
jgi:hypothetical protein